MTSHSRYAFVLALLAGVIFLAIETAEAKKSGLNIGQIAPPAQRLKALKVKPKIRPSQVPGHLNVPGIAARGRPNLGNVPPRLRLDPGKLNRQFLPADQPALVIPKPRVTKHKPRVPKLNQAKIGKVPLGQAANGLGRGPRNGAPGAAGVQNKPALPPVSTPPFNQDLVDAITVTGGAPDWWKGFENWSDLINARPGNFEPEFVPGGRGQRPEIDLNPFDPDRPGESGEQGGIGPRGWPGSAQGNSPFSDPSGKVSNGWTRVLSGGGRTANNDGHETWSTEIDDDGNTFDHSRTDYDDGGVLVIDSWFNADGTVDTYVHFTSSDGHQGGLHTRNGELVNDVHLTDPIVVTAGEDTGEDEGDEKGSDNPEDSQPGAEGAVRPRGGARDVDCGWWGCTDGGVSTPARTNPGHADNGGSTAVGGSIGPGAVTDPTPMDDTTGSSGGGYYDPGPGGDPGDPDAP
jgi:hypothetical protein